MATRILAPAATDLDSAASWGGSKPIAGDDVKILEGSQTVTAGLAAYNGVDFGSVFIGPECSVSFADDWEFDCTSGIVDHQGSGNLRLDGTLALIRSIGSGWTRVNGGAITTAIAQTGPVEITDQATIANAWSVFADMTIGSHASDRVDSLVVGRGRVDTKRSVESGRIGAGRLTFLDDATISDGAGSGICYLDGDGVLRMAGNAVTIDELVAGLGTLDPRLARGDITITNSSTPGLRVMAGADGSFGAGSVIFTNAPSPAGPGILPSYVGGGGLNGLGA